jgi:hypothetical protein
MTSIIAYGTVVRSPCMIGLPSKGERRSVVFSVVVDEDISDIDVGDKRRGLYRVIVQGSAVDYALSYLREGSAVLVKGELFPKYPAMGDPSWNHRVVFCEEVQILTGNLSAGRAFSLGQGREGARRVRV